MYNDLDLIIVFIRFVVDTFSKNTDLKILIDAANQPRIIDCKNDIAIFSVIIIPLKNFVVSF